MPFPSTAFEVAAVIVLLLPGLVYAVVRRTLKGYRPDDLAIDSRIAQALVVSVILDALYLALGWRWLSTLVEFENDSIVIVRPVALGLTVLLACGAIPALVAWLLNMPYRPRLRRDDETGLLLKWRRTIRSSDIPTAWDVAASVPDHRLVRVRRRDGTWIGGFYAEGSYVSTYPQPRDIYISVQREMSSDGEFGNVVADTDGVWLRINDDDIVEFVVPVYTAEERAALEALRLNRKRRPIWKKKKSEEQQ